MKKIALIFWPRGGNVEKAADMIMNALNQEEAERYSVTDVNEEILRAHPVFIVGGSTVGAETWREADDSNVWNDFFRLLDRIDTQDKKVAFFNLGDQVLYPLHFADDLRIFEDEFSRRKFTIGGRWPVEGYDFSDSEGVKDDHFFGLALDEDWQSDLSEERINQWLAKVKKEFGL